MINLHVSTKIYRPIKQVFEFVSTPENDFQWQYGTLAAARLPDGTDRLGSFFRTIGHLLGHRLQGVFEVTEYEPNSKYAFRSISGPMHLQTCYTFNIERLMERKMKKQLKENLALLKDLLESKEILPGTTAIS
jgi:hypothetical protein